MSTGMIFNVQRFSLHDGPGLRSTVFMKGCPLRCAWCHNPEGRSPLPELVRLRHRCMHCERCSEEELSNPVVIGRAAEDVDACPTGALQAVGEIVESTALVRTLLRDRIFFDESGGGVTFSGGEPLMQSSFVAGAMQCLQSEGVHTALDTCGFARWEELSAAASHASLVLYDLKLMDDERHKAATGVSNTVILRNLLALTSRHDNIWIRIPVIPGVNDDAANMESTASFLSPLRGIRQVDLLPYHATGEPKFLRVGQEYALHGTTTPAPDQLESLAARFSARGLHTTIGGHL